MKTSIVPSSEYSSHSKFELTNIWRFLLNKGDVKKQVNCWEHMNCSRETFIGCPAYPERGMECWKITGTKCGRGLIEKKTLEDKINHCRECDFFKRHAKKF